MLTGEAEGKVASRAASLNLNTQQYLLRLARRDLAGRDRKRFAVVLKVGQGEVDDVLGH